MEIKEELAEVGVLTINGEYKSLSRCLLGSAVRLPSTFIHGVAHVSVHVWQEGENHKAICWLRDIMVDFSNLISCRINDDVSRLPSRQCYCQNCLEDLRKLGLWFCGVGTEDHLWVISASRILLPGGSRTSHVLRRLVESDQ